MEPAIDWSLPYPSRRAPVFADHLVATSQPLAVAAGIDAMRRGGNAVDAAIATAITLTVVEPNNTGVGSDAFAIVWDGESLHGLNASGRAPAAWRPERFAGRASMPSLGWDSVTVPGAVSAWAALSERFGRLPFAALFEDAIGHAERGFPVGPKTSYYWQFAPELYRDYPAFLEHFLPGGHAPLPGDRCRRPELAATLREIAASGGESFYRGALARRIAADAERHGGALTLADLDRHAPQWVRPAALPYGGVVVHELPPNGQGLAAQIALGILAHHDLRALPRDGADATHLMIEAMKIAIRAAFDHFAEPEAMRVGVEQLLDADTLARLAGGIRRDAAATEPALLPVGPDTVYLATGDGDGMMVSLIQSNYQGFGSGIVIPGTGIAMQNRGAGFVLDPAHPNCVGGGKRPYHTIIPGFVTDNDSVTDKQKPRLAFGVMGGHMQHQGHVQMVHRLFDHGQNPQAASDAPRWHVSPDFRVGVEEGFPAATVAELTRRGHRVEYVPHEHVFGGAQLVLALDDGYCGASDHRKEGMAAGF